MKLINFIFNLKSVLPGIVIYIMFELLRKIIETH